ncbi:DUF4190 domain-containing protein [Gordonia sp. NPDC003504]
MPEPTDNPVPGSGPFDLAESEKTTIAPRPSIDFSKKSSPGSSSHGSSTPPSADSSQWQPTRLNPVSAPTPSLPPQPPRPPAPPALPPLPPPAAATPPPVYGAPQPPLPTYGTPSAPPPIGVPVYGQPVYVTPLVVGAPARRTNGMATAALVVSIIGAFMCLGWLGIIFGLIGRKQIRESQGAEDGDGMAIAGIVIGALNLLGLVVTVLWYVFAILLVASSGY